MPAYTRLSALDRSFLDIEKRNTHMHVGATCIFDAGPVTTADGGIDIGRIRAYVESRLHRIPRYRQRIAHIPLEGHPVWVDDDQFNIRYHVRHTSLPRPGDERQLKRLAGWINSQQLDRGKPLWEMWVIEGLEGGRLALIAKTHHCMIDGLAGADLLSVLLRPSPSDEIDEPHRWHPRPAPSGAILLRDAALRRAAMPLRTATAVVRDPLGMWRDASDLAAALYETTTSSLRPSSETPLNRAIGSHRRFDWLTMPLDRVKAVKNRLGGTVNDVVLAAVTGGLRLFFEQRGLPVEHEPDFLFRAFCPVGLHASSRRGTTGNFVSAMMTELPIDEDSPVRRLQRIREFTREHKDDATVRGTEVLEHIADWTAPTLLSSFASLLESSRAYNLIVTNVPGPQFGLYLLGARLQVSYPLVPLFGHQGLGIALLSYDGKLCWGLSADRDILPDLHDVVRAIAIAFDELCSAAGLSFPSMPEGREGETNGDAGNGRDDAETVDGDRLDDEAGAPSAVVHAAALPEQASGETLDG